MKLGNAFIRILVADDVADWRLGVRSIFVTQQNDPEVRMAALATGAEQYVVKANAASELLPAVEAALDPPLATTLSAAAQKNRRA